jgi:hypothetical protein
MKKTATAKSKSTKEKEKKTKVDDLENSDFDLSEANENSLNRAYRAKASDKHLSNKYEINVINSFERSMKNISDEDPERDVKIAHLESVLRVSGKRG